MNRAHWLMLLLILGLAAFLRLHRAAETPGWYSDEGTHLEIARNLLEGRVQYFALNQSTLLVARLPLFELLLAAAVQVAGVSMQTLRLLTGISGVLAVVLIYLVTRLTLTPKLALLAALLLAIYPQAVLYSRFGFSYNILALFALLMFVGLVRYRLTASRRWLLLAVMSVGLGLTCDVMMGAFVLPAVIVVLLRRPRDLLWGIPMMAAPFAVYAVVMLLTAPDAFLFDLHYTLTRLGGKSILGQLHDLAQNYTILLSQDFWLLAGLIGLCLMPTVPGTTALLLLLLPMALLGRTVALHNLSAYYMIPLLPFIALGGANFVNKASNFISQQWVTEPGIRRMLTYCLVMLLIALPLLMITLDTLDKVSTRYPTAIDPFLIDPGSARQVATFVNQHSAEDDLIIASPALGWMFEANTADFQMTVAYEGSETPHFPANVPKARFIFNPGIQQARFVVIDNLWDNWGAVHIPAVGTIQQTIETWPLVFEAGAIRVYENPSFATHPAE